MSEQALCGACSHVKVCGQIPPDKMPCDQYTYDRPPAIDREPTKYPHQYDGEWCHQEKRKCPKCHHEYTEMVPDAALSRPVDSMARVKVELLEWCNGHRHWSDTDFARGYNEALEHVASKVAALSDSTQEG